MSETLGITKEDLKDIVSAAVTAAVAESKKPAPLTAREEADLKQAQEMRAATGADVLRGIEQKKATQKLCTHEHSQRAGGGTHCVHVKESDMNSVGYVLCQLCGIRVRPEDPAMKKLDPQATYDNALFNKLIQTCNDTGEILG